MKKEDAEKLIDLFNKRDDLKINLHRIKVQLDCVKESKCLKNIYIGNVIINNSVSTECDIAIMENMLDIITEEYTNVCNLCNSYILSKKI